MEILYADDVEGFIKTIKPLSSQLNHAKNFERKIFSQF